MGEGPGEELFIGATFEGFGFERGVIDVEEGAAAGVESVFHGSAASFLPALGECSRIGEADFVEHATEVNEAFDLIEGAAKSGNEGWI